jgi:PAS domain S-box-containing protein
MGRHADPRVWRRRTRPVMLEPEGRCGGAGQRSAGRESVEDVQDEREDIRPVTAGLPIPAWAGGAVRAVADAEVAVLLLDTRRGLVTYANPAALAMTGGRAPLPVEAAAWSAAARLVLPTARQDGSRARPVVDPVSVVGAGGSVPGMRIEIDADGGEQQAYWVTGSQLLSGSNVAGTRAIVALFPVNASEGAARAGLSQGRHEHPAGALAGADGAAIMRADAVARDLVADETRREADAGTLPEAGDLDELTARALVASQVSFTISDPRRPDDPLVWVNPAFEMMTGYAADDAVGRNCRFLQGPGTDREAVAQVRQALERGEAVRAELLNYRKDGTPFWNAFTISPVVDGEGVLTHFVGVQTDITSRVIAGIEYERLLTAEREARTAAEQARSRLAVMVEVGAVLTETLDAEEAMRRLADAVVPALADYCAVDLQTTPDDARRAAAVHRDPKLGPLVHDLGPRPPGTPGGAVAERALRTGEPVHLADLGDDDYVDWAEGDERLLSAARTLRTRALVVAPLRARGRVLGALTLGHVETSNRGFDDEDLGLARTLAARAALAVDNSLLFEAESTQRRRADALAAAGTALAATGLASDEAVAVLLERVVPSLGPVAFVHADERSSPALRRPDAAAGLQLVGTRIDEALDPGTASAVALAAPLWPTSADAPGPGAAAAGATPGLGVVDDSLLGLLTEEQRRAVEPLRGAWFVSLPLTVRAVTFGTLTVVRPDGSPFAGDEVRFLGELGHRAALTLDNARLYESERYVALELQRSLLPARLPRLAELDVAGRYLAGAAGSEVGGDWYDVIPLPGGRVAVAVGDVMGRGVRAAAVMGQLRAALRSYAVEGLEPGDVLEHLAAFTQVLEGEHLVTCLVGVHDAAAGTVTFASAGHPPPLRLGEDGSVGYVDVEPGLPLGVPAALGIDGPARLAYAECTVKAAPGSTLMLFTDGLVEEREVPVAAGLDRLAAAFDGVVPATAEEACELALRGMGRDSSHDDDTAVLALRVTDLADAAAVPGLPGRVEPLQVVRTELPSNPHAASAARRVVAAALHRAGQDDLVDTAALLVSEVVTNALRHGGGPREMLVEIGADAIAVGVTDGSQQPPREEPGAGPGAVRVVDGGLAENGRGLVLVDLLADSWGWRPEPDGKLVWFRLRRD